MTRRYMASSLDYGHFLGRARLVIITSKGTSLERNHHLFFGVDEMGLSGAKEDLRVLELPDPACTRVCGPKPVRLGLGGMPNYEQLSPKP